MSGSPKYSSIALAAARRAQAQAERAARARLREEKRQQRLAAALQRSRDKAGGRCSSVISRQAALRQPAEAAGLGQEAASQAADLQQIAAEIERAVNHGALRAANRRLDRMESGIEALNDAIVLRREAAVSARLEQLDSRLESIPRAVRMQLDPSGARVAEDAIAVAASARGAQSSASLADVARKVREHLERVRSAQAERAAALRDAEFQVEELASKLAVLQADSRDLPVKLEGADLAGTHLDDARELVATGHLEGAVRLLPQLAEMISRIERAFDEAVDRFVERRRILTSIVAGLPDLGFAVVSDSLTEQPDGSVSVRAETISGETLDVLVHDGDGAPHEVLYASSELESEETIGSITGSTCGSLVELIGALNERAGQDGYITGTVLWDDGGSGPDTDGSSRRAPHQEVPGRRAHG